MNKSRGACGPCRIAHTACDGYANLRLGDLAFSFHKIGQPLDRSQSRPDRKPREGSRIGSSSIYVAITIILVIIVTVKKSVPTTASVLAGVARRWERMRIVWTSSASDPADPRAGGPSRSRPDKPSSLSRRPGWMVPHKAFSRITIGRSLAHHHLHDTSTGTGARSSSHRRRRAGNCLYHDSERSNSGSGSGSSSNGKAGD
jgi:hypothetical protein